jgi:7,8-dihydropterin-6-yl-methyl-4-(beta-D-ribofuranosyl)aminobenzene 5'-phosphate synthase
VPDRLTPLQRRVLEEFFARETGFVLTGGAALGGFHLFGADEKTLAWTAAQLRKMSIAYFMGAHCTGIEAVFRLRQLLGLSRRTCVVGAVGASFELGKGLDPLPLAH